MNEKLLNGYASVEFIGMFLSQCCLDIEMIELC